jgi:anti-anti-sigma factor
MFTVGIDVHDGMGTVTLSGDLDHGTAEALRTVALTALSDGVSNLVLDCSELTFIDSTGLNVLNEANKAARAQSGTLTIRNPPDLMARLMYVTQLDEVLDIENGQDAPGQVEGLTQREAGVLALVAEGRTNREIGDALFIGEQTVKSHMRGIFAKLGVTNRTQAARCAIGQLPRPSRVNGAGTPRGHAAAW